MHNSIDDWAPASRTALALNRGSCARANAGSASGGELGGGMMARRFTLGCAGADAAVGAAAAADAGAACA